jgi:hypothetical protein
MRLPRARSRHSRQLQYIPPCLLLQPAETHLRHVRVRQEEEKSELVLVEVRHFRKIGERRRLIRCTRLPTFDEMAACAPTFRERFALSGISRK